MQHTSRIISVIVALSLILGVFWLSASPTDQTDARAMLAIKRVRVATVEAAHGSHVISFSGTLRAEKRAELGFTLAGRIIKRPVNIGQTVKKGDLLAQIDRLPLQNALAAAKAQLAQVKAQQEQAIRDVNRVQGLYDNKAATIEELEQLQARQNTLVAQRQAAETATQEAERQLNEATLRAPFDAVIAETYLQTGEFALPGSPVFSLVGSKGLELEVEVPESVYTQLQVGDPVSIELPFDNNRQISGTLRDKALSNGRPGRLFPILVDVRDDEANPGQTARLNIELPSEGVMVVPIASVLNPGGSKPTVFRIKNNKAERVDVEIGRLNDEMVEVRGALEQGDEVATSGFFGLLDGDAVEVLR